MTGTTTAVVSAKYTVTYSLCSTSSISAASTSPFKPSVDTTYGAVSSVELVSTSNTPFTTSNGYCPDVMCVIVEPLAGQTLVKTATSFKLQSTTFMNATTPVTTETINVWCKTSYGTFVSSPVTFTQVPAIS